MIVPAGPAAIQLAFDPTLQLGDLVVPWRALGVAAAVLVGLLAAAAQARRFALRADDLLFIALGVVAGGVIGGRLVHGIVFAEAYAADPLALADPARGSLSLLGAIVGGSAAGAFICWRLDAPVGGWADAVAAPMLLAIGLGKLAQLLAGSGQGLPTDLPWALAFAGPGPWGSTSPGTPAHPAQVYEGLWALAGVPIVLALIHRAQVRGTFGVGRVFLAALAFWLAGRIAVATTWRDPVVLGPLNAEQLLAIALFAAIAVAVTAAVRLRP